jgi:hypothetical protein
MRQFFQKLPFYEYILITIGTAIMVLVIGVFVMDARMVTGV